MKHAFFYFLASFLILTGCKQTTNPEEKEKYSSETLSVYEVTDQVYKHVSYLDTESFGKVSCNGMIVIDSNEAIIFDTPTNDAASSELINWITNELNAKIVAVVATHYHGDNIGGLNEFHKYGIPSYALQKTIDITKENNYPQPQHAFESFIELNVGKEKVYVDFLGGGHTCDNTIGYFPAGKIMFGGCLLKEVGAGKGNLEEASVDEWAETVKKVKAKYPATKWVIPGHGKSGGTELFDYTINLFDVTGNDKQINKVTMKIFYQDYHTDKGIDSAKPEEASLESALALFYKLTEEDGNFFGITSYDGEKCLQFMYTEPDTWIVDIPDMKKNGSWQKETDYDECIALIHDFYNEKQIDMTEFVFESFR